MCTVSVVSSTSAAEYCECCPQSHLLYVDCVLFLCKISETTIFVHLIGASLSEPHIDHDNVPRRGECLYLSSV